MNRLKKFYNDNKVEIWVYGVVMAATTTAAVVVSNKAVGACWGIGKDEAGVLCTAIVVEKMNGKQQYFSKPVDEAYITYLDEMYKTVVEAFAGV